MNSQQFEYKVVGTDENGNELYQKVPVAPTLTKPAPVINGQVKRLKELNQSSDFLYDDIDPELVKLRHERSQQQFPSVKFLEKEFVVRVINRHPLGILLIWVVAGVITTLMAIVWISLTIKGDYGFNYYSSGLDASIHNGALIIGLIALTVAMFAVIFTRVYKANRMIITTERVIQFISNGLFDLKKQTIDLSWIEDVSYHQKGFFATVVDYGSLRLSTIGDESTYYFIFTPSPSGIATKINSLVFSIKNEKPLNLAQIDEEG